MSVVGTRVLRKEDPAFLTTGATYTADLRVPRLEGAAHVTYVRSTMAHAVITGIDTSEAQAMPGVLGVYTHADLDEATSVLPGMVPMFPPSMLNRPILATERVRFVGECVAVIVSETAAQGEDAAEMVYVDYEPLTAVVDMEEAATDENIVFEDVGTNIAIDFANVRDGHRSHRRLLRRAARSRSNSGWSTIARPPLPSRSARPRAPGMATSCTSG